MSLLPDISEIEEDIRKNPEKYIAKKATHSSGAFKRKKRDKWISDFEQEKFLNDPEWNDLTMNPDAAIPQHDRNKGNYIEFKNRLSKKDYDDTIEVLSLFIERCIPKPFWSIALRGAYNGWTLSCMPGSYGLVGVSVGKHYVANVELDEDFTIYIRKEDIVEQFGSFTKFEIRYPNISTRPCDGTVKGKEHNVLCFSMSMQDAKEVLIDSKIILSVRRFATILINQSQTPYHKFQCETLVDQILGQIK